MLVATLALLPLLAGAGDPTAATAARPAPAIVRSVPGVERRLRADFAPASAMLVVFTESWPEVVDAIAVRAARRTDVYVLREDETPAATVTAWHADLPPELGRRVHLLDIEVGSPWVRDYGPIHVEQGRGRWWVDAEYGPERPNDEDLPRRVAGTFGAAVEQYGEDLDGGAFVSNGEGLCIAVTEYFDLHGPDLDDRAGLDELQRRLGCPTLVMVAGPDGDGTRHADMIAQFIAVDALVLASSQNEGDRRKLDAAEAAIVDAAADRGLSLKVVRVPSFYGPADRYWSYTNFVQLAGALLVPSYGTPGSASDAEAVRALRRALPGKSIESIAAAEPAYIGGALHCLTNAFAWP